MPHLQAAGTTTPASGVTYRRDRFGECWHLVPQGSLGPRGRTLCGEPRQGTSLSETYADVQPSPPDCICGRCSAAASLPPTRRTDNV